MMIIMMKRQTNVKIVIQYVKRYALDQLYKIVLVIHMMGYIGLEGQEVHLIKLIASIFII